MRKHRLAQDTGIVLSVGIQKLEGKCCVITGATSGIGLATARLFVEHGAKVVHMARRADNVERTTAELGDRAIGIAGDVANVSDLFTKHQETSP